MILVIYSVDSDHTGPGVIKGRFVILSNIAFMLLFN